MGQARRDFGQRGPGGVGDQPQFAAKVVTRDLERHDAVDRERDRRGGDADARGDGRMRRYQLLSAINAVHASTAHARDTDWARIVALYDALERVDPSPVVTLNKAIAVSEYDSPQVALAMVERLGGALDRHHGFHTARAGLLARVGRSDDALVAYDCAIALTANSAEVAHLIRRRSDLRHRTEGETQ